MLTGLQRSAGNQAVNGVLAQRSARRQEERALGAVLQREAKDEEDDEPQQTVQTKPLGSGTLQRQGTPEPEEEEEEEKKPVQAKASVGLEGGPLSSAAAGRIQSRQGGGAPLDAATRTRMEAAFGADFAGVGVHTDTEADALNRAVSAVAFTTGKDVFFSHGAYQPGTPDGDHLLAHELTHVVQQQGSPATASRMTVGPAGDHHEQEAEATAARVAGALWHGQSQGEAAPGTQVGATANYIRRHRKTLDTWGSAFNPTGSYIDYTDSFATVEQNDGTGAHVGPPGNDQAKFAATPQEQTIALQEGAAAGAVTFVVNAKWKEVNLVSDDEGSASYRVKVPYTVATDNTLQWAQPIVEDSATTGSGAALVIPVPVSTGAGPSEGFVSVAPTISGSESTTHQGGGAAGAGPFTVSVPYSKSTTANTTNAYTASYTLRLRPTPPTPVGLPSVFFKVGKADLEDGGEGTLANAFMTLPAGVLTAIRQGKRPIVIEAYASTTGKHGRNRELSQQRAAVVQTILKGLAGDHADFNILYYGKEAALAKGDPNEREDPMERRTDITVKTQAPK
jgi:outer membrane protein OmpA-like peptidoglycan-associated protein